MMADLASCCVLYHAADDDWADVMRRKNAAKKNGDTLPNEARWRQWTRDDLALWLMAKHEIAEETAMVLWREEFSGGFLKLSYHGVSVQTLVDLGLTLPAAAGVLGALESLDGFVPTTSDAAASAVAASSGTTK